MSARKSIAKVQLGSVTPEKGALQGKTAGDEGIVLPQINGHSQPDIGPSEIRSAEKPPGAKVGGPSRPMRGTILQPRPSGSSSGKGSNENAESNARPSRPSILHKQGQGQQTQTPHGEASHASDPNQSLRISRPSILNKQPSANKGVDAFDRKHSAAKNGTTAEGSLGPHSPAAPNHPKGSNRSHRGTVLKHLPKGQTSEASKSPPVQQKSDINFFASSVARKLINGVISQSVSNFVLSRQLQQKNSVSSSRSQILTGFVEELARDCISLSIRDALQNITTKGTAAAY